MRLKVAPNKKEYFPSPHNKCSPHPSEEAESIDQLYAQVKKARQEEVPIDLMTQLFAQVE